MRSSMFLALVASWTVALWAVPVASAKDLGATVIPRLTLGGRLISTLDATWADGEGRGGDDRYDVNIADTSLLLRADRKLFDKSIGGAVVGLEFPDPDADFTDTVFYHQVFAFLWDRSYQVELGRTKLRNTLVEFPTLRDDDLLRFTEIQNGFSQSNTEEFQQFGNHLAVDLFFPAHRMTLTGYLAQRIETDAGGNVRAEFDINSGGLQVQFEQPEGLRFSGRLRQLGVGWDVQQVDAGRDEWKHALVAGGVVNLTMDPQDHWEGLAQVIYDGGAGPLDLTSYQGRSLAETLAVVAGVSFRHSTFQLLRWKASLTGAYKNYLDEGGAWEWSAVPSFQYQLGDGVGLLVQYQYTDRGQDLARAVGFDGEHTVQVGLNFDFETLFNDYIGERRSILNLEHGYVR
ncbi:MAG: hypothetical protein Kow0092_29700 [Deferrisomatales bacterium]